LSWSISGPRSLRTFDNAHAEKIFSALRRRPEGMTRTELNTQVFQGHLNKRKMSEALNYLSGINLAYSSVEQNPGRPSERWFIRSKSKEAEEYD
jgi:molybdenum cofactor biosynthesis enzyme MoaA